MYAIIETGGKQYRVAPGDVVSLEKLDGNVGQKLTFDKLLLIGGKANSQTLIGTPYVEKALLEAEIVEQTKGEKIRTVKYRRRKGYRRTLGHRQLLTRILVTKVEDGQGETSQFDATKRNEILRKASVKFSTRQALHEQKHQEKLQAATSQTTKKKAAPAASESAEKAPTKKKTVKKV